MCVCQKCSADSPPIDDKAKDSMLLFVVNIRGTEFASKLERLVKHAVNHNILHHDVLCEALVGSGTVSFVCMFLKAG